MRRKSALVTCVLLALAAAPPALARDAGMSVNIRAQPLSSALQELARQTGAELLYDRDVTSGVRSPAVRARLTAEAAIRLMLANTDLGVRRAASGALIIERRGVEPVVQDLP